VHAEMDDMPHDSRSSSREEEREEVGVFIVMID
jgi:hypothetical protein